MIGALFYSLLVPALAGPLDPGNCGTRSLIETRDLAMEASPIDRPRVVTDGLMNACPDMDDDLRMALFWWRGEGNRRGDRKALIALLCATEASVLERPLTGSFKDRMDNVWGDCDLKKQKLLKRKDLAQSGGPLSITIASNLYQQLRNRGISDDVAIDLGKIIAGVHPIDRGLFGDIAGRSLGAALPQSGGLGVTPQAACSPIVVVDVGVIRLDGEGIITGQPKTSADLPFPGLAEALLAWLPQPGCTRSEVAFIAPDHLATYSDLRKTVATIQGSGYRAQLLLAAAPDISMSGKPRSRREGMALKAWPIDDKVSPDVPLSSRIKPPPILRLKPDSIHFILEDAQPGRRNCESGPALVCAYGDKFDPDSYDWSTLFRTVGDVRTRRGVGTIDSIEVMSDDQVNIGVLVKALDSWAWGLREGAAGEVLSPPPIVLVDVR